MRLLHPFPGPHGPVRLHQIARHRKRKPQRSIRHILGQHMRGILDPDVAAAHLGHIDIVEPGTVARNDFDPRNEVEELPVDHRLARIANRSAIATEVEVVNSPISPIRKIATDHRINTLP